MEFILQLNISLKINLEFDFLNKVHTTGRDFNDSSTYTQPKSEYLSVFFYCYSIFIYSIHTLFYCRAWNSAVSVTKIEQNLLVNCFSLQKDGLHAALWS